MRNSSPPSLDPIQTATIVGLGLAASSAFTGAFGFTLVGCTPFLARLFVPEDAVQRFAERLGSSFQGMTSSGLASWIQRKLEGRQQDRELSFSHHLARSLLSSLRDAFDAIDLLQSVSQKEKRDRIRAAWDKRLEWAADDTSYLADFFKEASNPQRVLTIASGSDILKALGQRERLESLLWNDILREMVTCCDAEDRASARRALSLHREALLQSLQNRFAQEIIRSPETAAKLSHNFQVFATEALESQGVMIAESRSEIKEISGLLDNHTALISNLHKLVIENLAAGQAHEVGLEALANQIEREHIALKADRDRTFEAIRALTRYWQESTQNVSDQFQILSSQQEQNHAEILSTLLELPELIRLPPISSQWQTLDAAVRNQVQEALRSEKSPFFRRDVSPSLYYPRIEQEQALTRFANGALGIAPEDSLPCFVLVGRQGKGKTTLLCQMARRFSQADSQFLSLLTDCRDAFRDSGNDVESFLLEHCDPTTSLPDSGHGRLSELAGLLRSGGKPLIVFLDGLNELAAESAESLEAFHRSFSDVLQEIQHKKYPIRFCISCRTVVWEAVRDTKWAKDHVFEPTKSTGQSSEVSDFPFKDIETISQLYFREYKIEAKLATKAVKEAYCDPIMLRYLCLAYKGRDDIGDIVSVRRKEVFDLFVQETRVAIWDRVSDLFPDQRHNTAKIRFDYVTKYLLHLAYRMYEENRASIEPIEALQVADSLDHPDARLGPETIATSQTSVFFHLCDQGIILRQANDGSFQFTFEAYFEYTLGRYFAWVLWPDLLGKGKGVNKKFRQEVRSQLRGIKHSSGLRANLLGALEYAVLISEEAPAEGEPTFFLENPEIFGALLQWMASSHGLGMIGKQIACAVIRETRVLNNRASGNPDDRSSNTPTGSLATFDILLDALDVLTSATDFVVLWDVERTLVKLANADFDVVEERLARWIQEGGLRAISAVRCIGKLAHIDPYYSAQRITELGAAPDFRSNFWLAREVVQAALSLIQNFGSEGSLSLRRQFVKVRELIFQLAEDSDCRYVRGVALAALPHLGSNDEETLRRITRLSSETEWIWSRWNLVFSLRKLVDLTSSPYVSWIEEELARSREVENPHLDAAIRSTARSLAKRTGDAHWYDLSLELSSSPHEFPSEPITAIVFDHAFLEPEYDNHIECRERIQVLINHLERLDPKPYALIRPDIADEDEHLRLVHRSHYDSEKNGDIVDRHRDGSPWPNYVEDLKRVSESLEDPIPSDLQWEQTGPTELRYESFGVAKRAVGSVLSAVEHVRRFPGSVAWSFGRPPGHLANNTICMFNNIAIGARWAQQQSSINRILIIDCDAHHGIHTNRVFNKDRTVVYFSTHVEGDYSEEEGKHIEAGKEEGLGYTFNVPFPRFLTDDGYRDIIDRLLRPVLRDFEPELVMISAGFDAHIGDPLTRTCTLTENAFILLAQAVREYCEERGVGVVGALEGGYGLAEMASCQTHMLNILGDWGLDPEEIGFTWQHSTVELTINRRIEEHIRNHPEDQKATNAEEYHHEARSKLHKMIEDRIELSRRLDDQDPHYPFAFAQTTP